MNVFGDHWENHEEKIVASWKTQVKEDDLVLLPGDISWAMTIEEAYDDLKMIHSLPGKKVMIKGNHDYWWSSRKKLDELNLSSIFFLQNDAYFYDGVMISGTRGWNPPDAEDFDEHDEKIFKRELGRLKNSLTYKKNEDKIFKKIVMMHYPPFYFSGEPTAFVEMMREHDTDICVYGHLHAEGHKLIREGKIEGIQFICGSSDYINFQLIPIGV